MPFLDLPLHELQTYLPPRDEPADFDAFWARTLAEARAHPLDPCFAPFDAGLTTLQVFDVTFNGYGGQPIKGWLLFPAHRDDGALPCIVQYIGYGGGRGFAIDWLLWASAGYALCWLPLASARLWRKEFGIGGYVQESLVANLTIRVRSTDVSYRRHRHVGTTDLIRKANHWLKSGWMTGVASTRVCRDPASAGVADRVCVSAITPLTITSDTGIKIV